MFWSSVGQRGCVGLLLRSWSSTLRRTPTTTPGGCPLHISKVFFSASTSIRCPTREEEEDVVKQWALQVSPFTTIKAKLDCSISIRPLDPHTFPEADRAFIKARSTDSQQEAVAAVDQFHVHYDDTSKELLISAYKVHSSVSLDVTAPLKSNLFITTRDKGNVQIKHMECDICKVQTEMGNCVLHSVKGHQVEVVSSGGHVTGVGTIHGNVNISTRGDSAVDIKKLQGTTMNVSTERGPLKVKAMYADSSCVSSCSGRVELGNVHGNATVTNMSGDTIIDGSNSFLKVSSQSGVIDVYVGHGGSAELQSREGSVHVRVPSSLRAGVELCGESVDISPEVALQGGENNTSQGQTTVTGYINGESTVAQQVKVQADRGSVTLKTQSWFESLKLAS